jgi:hypothetical protein
LGYEKPVSTDTKAKILIGSFLPFSTASTLSDRLLRGFGAVQHGLSVWPAFPSASFSKWSRDLGSSTSKLRSRHQVREADQKTPEARLLFKPLELTLSMM